jgi:CelD/BcsL family acetyltransferase involved in cellulose biosynthesis
VRAAIYRGPHQWGSIGDAWVAIAAEQRLGAHTQLAEWASAFDAEVYGPDARWFRADDHQGPVAVVPFTVERRTIAGLPLRVLANVRNSDGMVAGRIPPRALRRELLRAMAESGEPVDVLSFNGIRAGSGVYRLASASPDGLAVETAFGGYSIVDTRLSGDEWLASAGKNLKANLRKARNRLEREGALRIEVATTPEEVAAAFEGFVEIEASGWKGGVGGLAKRPTERALIRNFVDHAVPVGRGQARTLRVGDRLAAAQLSAIAGDTLVLLKVAYRDDLSHLSPSNLLMADLIRECCDRPDIARIDLVTDQPWHDRWHPSKHPTYRVRDFNLRRAGGVAGRAGDTAGRILAAMQTRARTAAATLRTRRGLPDT